MRRGRCETPHGLLTKYARVGAERLQEDSALSIAHQIGKAGLQRIQRGDTLRRAGFLAIEDIHDGQRQDALRGLLHRVVECLVQPVLDDQSGDQRHKQPENGDPQGEPVNKLLLQAGC